MGSAAVPAAGGRLTERASTAAWAVLGTAVAAGAGLLVAVNPRIAVTVVLCLAGAAAVHYRPYETLLLLLIAALVQRTATADTVAFAVIVGGSPVILWRLIRAPGKVFLLPLFAFVLIALAGVRFSQGDSPVVNPRTLVLPFVHFRYLTLQTVEIQDWMRLAVVPVGAVLAATSIRTLRQLQLAVGVVVVGALVPLYDGIRQIATGDLVARKGAPAAVRGSFEFPNEFALYLVVILVVITVAAFVVRRTNLRAGLIVLAGGGIFMLLHTYTRAAWIAFAIALAVLAVLRYRSLLAIAFVTLVVSIAGFPGAVHEVQQRFGDLTAQNQANASNSLQWRRGQWRAMWHWGTDAPITGQGFGSYRRLTVRQFGLEGRTYATVGQPQGTGGALEIGFTAHNDYIKTYVENGIPGLALWIAVFVTMAIVQVRASRVPELAPWAVAMLAALTAIAIMSFSDNVQGYGEPLLYACALTGGLAALTARRSELRATDAAT